MSIQLILARRYLAGRKLRTALTTLAIVLGVMLIFGLNALMPGMMAAMQQLMLASVGQVDLTVTNVAGGTFTPDVGDELEVIEGVRAVTPVLRRTVALAPEAGYDVSSLVVVGIEPSTAERVQPRPRAAGRSLKDSDAGLEVVTMSTTVAEKLGLKIGDTLTIPSASGSAELKLVGTLEAPAVPGSDEVFVPLATAQHMFAARDRVTELDVAFEAEADRNHIEAAARALLDDTYTVGAISSESALAAGFRIGSAMMSIFGLFALAMGGFIILNTFRMMVAERRHDIGMLRAIGASRRMILSTFLIESLLQGILGTVIGLIAGWGLAWLANNAMGAIVEDLMNIGDTKPVFTAGNWIQAIVLGIGITVGSALVPARAAARITPLDALRPQMGDAYEKAATRRAWVGLAMMIGALGGLLSGDIGFVGLSALLLLVGMVFAASAAVRPITNVFSKAIELVYRSEGSVARANLQRNPGRAAATASAVMVSIALIVALVGTISSIMQGYGSYAEKSTGTDFLILPQNLLLGAGTIGADQELIEEIRHTPGMGDVATLRFGQSVYKDTSIQVVGIDPVAYPKIASFEWAEGSSDADMQKLLRDGTMVINGNFAGSSGAGKGGRVDLMTPSGTKSFRVVAQGNDYINAKLPTVYISQRSLERWWNVTSDVAVLANAKPGANQATVLVALQETIEEYPSFQMYDAAAWRKVQTDMFAQMESMYYFMALLLAVPSLLALLNTLAMGVLARTREIGMLRAVGSTRRQIKRMVVAESLLLAALGVAAGLVAGVWMGYVLIKAIAAFGLVMPYVFPMTGIVLAVVVGLVFAGLAALIPARQAARLDIIRALRYE